MAIASPPPPTKLFREEAQVAAVQCPACGGPIARRGFGAIQRVACPYCGSESKPEPGGALHLIEQAQRQRRSSALPLHARGTLEGAPWEILGIVWRECEADGVVYPWQEFLLFNPYKGYRYLVYSMSDGHWTFGGALAGAPQAQTSLGHRRVQFKRVTYKHFQTVLAKVTYVEGEFPWQVHAGDRAVVHEYIRPPRSISIEESYDAEGQDVNFTAMDHIGRDEVWKAFGMRGSPPLSMGVGPCRPNPWRKGSKTTWFSMGALLMLWLLATLSYTAGRRPDTVLERTALPITEPIAQTIEVDGTRPTVLELEFRAYPLSNAWAYLDVLLIPVDREEAIGFGVTAEEWHGVSGGESWREGDPSPEIVVGGVSPGTYELRIEPSAGTQLGGPPSDLRYDVVLRQDVVLVRYILLALAVIVLFPLVFLLLAAFYEGRRWQNSDYAS